MKPEDIRAALIRWLNYPPDTSLTLAELGRDMERGVKRYGAVLAPYYADMAATIEAQAHRIRELEGRE